jgi:phosphoribosyl 1,2-cyclic phosphodiesterase
MSAFLCSLASGSLGNALLVASAKARVLVDMGLTQQRLTETLEAAGVAAADLSAIFLTHTHRDHISTAAVGFCLAHSVPVYSTEANLAHLAGSMAGFKKLAGSGLARMIDGRPVEVGDIAVEAFDVPHDSEGDCVGFRLHVGPARQRRTVAVATDLGHLPADALAAFIDSHAVVLESNHDPEMLWASRRPEDLKARIAGPDGHLSNETCAEAVAEIVGRSHAGRARDIILAHLSRDCNTPHLALAAQAHLARSRKGEVRISTATQYEVGPRIEL